ncbi:MAG TPA: hypothetical protein VIJ12_01930 [Candidatus Baltobacteraceae bacterium]
MLGKVTVLAWLLLGVAGVQQPLRALPPILQPQLHDGEQFRYQLTFDVRGGMSDRMEMPFTDSTIVQPGRPLAWTRRYTGGDRSGESFAFQLDSSGNPINQTLKAASADVTFLYNRELFGDPPASFALGSTWQSRVTGPNPFGPPFGIIKVKVASIDAAKGLVVLAFAYDVDAHIRYPADHGEPSYSSHDVAKIIGSATFKNGIMTSLNSGGPNGHDLSNGNRITYTLKQTLTLLQ